MGRGIWGLSFGGPPSIALAHWGKEKFKEKKKSGGKLDVVKKLEGGGGCEQKN
jgi:hypothetical protein